MLDPKAPRQHAADDLALGAGFASELGDAALRARSTALSIGGSLGVATASLGRRMGG
jgi:hypothetical protein